MIQYTIDFCQMSFLLDVCVVLIACLAYIHNENDLILTVILVAIIDITLDLIFSYLTMINVVGIEREYFMIRCAFYMFGAGLLTRGYELIALALLGQASLSLLASLSGSFNMNMLLFVHILMYALFFYGVGKYAAK